MKKLALGLIIVPLALQARVVTKVQVRALVTDVNNVNRVIESETDVTRSRCMNQQNRKRDIDDTIASLNSSVRGIRAQIDAEKAADRSHEDALAAAQANLATALSAIHSLEGQIAAYGHDGVREAALKAEIRTLQGRIQKSRADRRAAQDVYNAWAGQPANQAILNSAHHKLGMNPPQALAGNEGEAINNEYRFVANDERFLQSVNVDNRQLSDDQAELASIGVADQRSLSELTVQKQAKERDRDSANSVISREKPIVDASKAKVRHWEGMIASLTGVNTVELNPDCRLLLQTQ